VFVALDRVGVKPVPASSPGLDNDEEETDGMPNDLLLLLLPSIMMVVQFAIFFVFLCRFKYYRISGRDSSLYDLLRLDCKTLELFPMLLL
jgi:hypothetical protein